MDFRVRFATFALFALAFAPALQRAFADETARPAATGTQHVCLDPKERRAEIESGRLIRIASAMRAARSRMPGTVIGARLCRGPDGLVYVLTVLAHDGRVARITVDAVKGTLVGER
jgi:uncharacterized membrane protein YkoI